MGADTERETIARCRDGDPAAWDALFDLHYNAAGRFVFQLSPDLSREDTEEICQETFLAAIRNLASFRGTCRFQTWLFRIATNKTRDFLERRQAAKRGGGLSPVPLDTAPPGDGAPAIDPPAPGPRPDGALLDAERALQVRTGLDRLGDPCREILELRYFGDLSYDEISAALDLNPKTVSSRLSKCLDRLGEILKSMFSEDERHAQRTRNAP
jgi:RNA polymerase sigma-70 factor (ECF subfamily)